MTLVLSSSLCSLLRLSFYLNLSGRNCLLSPPVLAGYNGYPDTCFFWETMQLISWPDGEGYLCPLQFFCSLFPLISRIHSSLFSDWRRTVSSKFFDTQVPSISTEEDVLPCHPCCVLFRLCFNRHHLLLSSYLSGLAESRILPATPVELVPGHYSSHSAPYSYGLLAPLTLWRLSVSL